MEHKPLILQVFLFLAGLVVFNWPIMSIAATKGSAALFVYLFIGWVLFIAILWVIIHWVTRTMNSKQSGRSQDV